jgi:SpoVK/Ycf46/Vps4 family AAA+-type ATPase
MISWRQNSIEIPFNFPLTEQKMVAIFVCSGADLAALVREASMAALRERISMSSLQGRQAVNLNSGVNLHGVGIANRHFDVAFCRVKPSVSKKVSNSHTTIPTDNV